MTRGAGRFTLGVVAAVVVAATPSAAASGATLIIATTQNPTPHLVTVGRYSLAAVLPSAADSNPRSALTTSLTASNNRAQAFLLKNFGELEVTAFTVSQSMTSNVGAATAITSYCAGGTSGGAFQSTGVCAGGGALTRAVSGSQSAIVTLTIKPGESREFQMVTQSPTSGKDNTVTLSVAVAGSGVKSGAATNA